MQTIPKFFFSLAATLLALLVVGGALCAQLLTVRAQSAPQLYIAGNLHVAEGGRIAVPVSYQAHGNDIAALVFSVDYDETCLSLDLTDADHNGRPDSILPLIPTGMVASITVDATDTDGEIDVIVADYVPPFRVFTDTEALLLISFTASCRPPAGGEQRAPVNFSTDPSPSFGKASGQEVTGVATNGAVTVVSNRPAATATPTATGLPTTTPTATIVPTTGPLTPTVTPTLIPTVAPQTIVESFSAELVDGGVRIAWQTSHEQNTQSFRVHRIAVSQETAFMPISDALPGAGPDGGSYQFLDTQIDPALTYTYLLVEEKQSGRSVAYYELIVVVGFSGNGPLIHQLHIPLVRR